MSPASDFSPHLMRHIVARLSASNRYQGSLQTVGLCLELRDQLREMNARCACEVIEIPLDRQRSFLGFEAPAAWDLLYADVEVRSDDGAFLRRSESGSPLLIASNSNAFSGELSVIDVQAEPSSDSIVLLSADGDWSGSVASVAKSSKARGFITDAFARSHAGIPLRGRLELQPDSDLFGVSVTRPEMDLIRGKLQSGAVRARIDVAVSQEGALPILEYRGEGEGEPAILLIAHICHPRPGANDNASGVAVAVEVCRRLTAMAATGRKVPPVRFIAGPEFTGTAAYLACRDVSSIELVINIDTVGGDPALTGGRLLLERAPAFMRGELHDLFISHIAHAVESGGLDVEIAPFRGYSDHAIFAAAAVDIPAVQFGQVGDRFNHTDGDVAANLCFNRMDALARTIAEFIVAHGETTGRKTHSLQTGQTPEPDGLAGPFNIRKVARLALAKDREWLMAAMAANKNIYGALQATWLAFQWANSGGAIEQRLANEFPDIGRDTAAELIRLCSDVRRTLTISAPERLPL